MHLNAWSKNFTILQKKSFFDPYKCKNTVNFDIIFQIRILRLYVYMPFFGKYKVHTQSHCTDPIFNIKFESSLFLSPTAVKKLQIYLVVLLTKYILLVLWASTKI